MLIPYFSEDLIEAGCDEAGRGCLAGPVFAAAVILPKDFSNEILNDSKLLNEKQRYSMRELILEEALHWAVASIDNTGIDDVNILNASIQAMHDALDKLKVKPEMILVDGNRFKNYKDTSYKCIVKGDSKYMSIAAASVLAKTYRDDYMKQLHEEFPLYNWIKNKGYGTLDHRKAIKKYGLTDYHRRSFNMNEQLKLRF